MEGGSAGRKLGVYTITSVCIASQRPFRSISTMHVCTSYVPAPFALPARPDWRKAVFPLSAARGSLADPFFVGGPQRAAQICGPPFLPSASD